MPKKKTEARLTSPISRAGREIYRGVWGPKVVDWLELPGEVRKMYEGIAERAIKEAEDG